MNLAGRVDNLECGVESIRKELRQLRGILYYIAGIFSVELLGGIGGAW